MLDLMDIHSYSAMEWVKVSVFGKYRDFGKSVFPGVDEINMDGKGRFSIPTKYRDDLKNLCDGKMVVTATRDHFLLLYPYPLWEQAESELMELSTLNRAGEHAKRFNLAYASQCNMDGHGRVLLPEKLRTFARLDKKMVLSSQVDRFEIWAEKAWEESVDAWLVYDNPEELKELKEHTRVVVI